MIVLDDEIWERIREHGRRCHPNEACGVLLGRLPHDGDDTRVVQRELALDNSREAGEQYHRFVITPRDYLAAERRADDLGLDIVGFYHSHPDHPAIPSDYDRDHAFPGLSYIVTSVVGKGLAAPRVEKSLSWTLSVDRSEFLFEADLDENRPRSVTTAPNNTSPGTTSPGTTSASTTSTSTTSTSTTSTSKE